MRRSHCYHRAIAQQIKSKCIPFDGAELVHSATEPSLKAGSDGKVSPHTAILICVQLLSAALNKSQITSELLNQRVTGA